MIALNVAAGNVRTGDIGKCHFADLESQFNVLLAELLCKIHEPVCFLSKLPYINLSQVTTGFTNSINSANTQPGANTSTGNSFNISNLSSAAGLSSVTDLQNLFRVSTSKVTLNTTADRFGFTKRKFY